LFDAVLGHAIKKEYFCSALFLRERPDPTAGKPHIHRYGAIDTAPKRELPFRTGAKGKQKCFTSKQSGRAVMGD
jgi:hypothetical protein